MQIIDCGVDRLESGRNPRAAQIVHLSSCPSYFLPEKTRQSAVIRVLPLVMIALNRRCLSALEGHPMWLRVKSCNVLHTTKGGVLPPDPDTTSRLETGWGAWEAVIHRGQCLNRI